MKKAFVVLMVMAIVIMGNTYEVFLYAKKVLFGDPVTHVIQQGEYLSKIARQYYGDVSFWRELALVNRAPDSDLVFPGEKIIIPRREVMLNIRKARSLTDVNLFVRGEEDILARLDRSDIEAAMRDETEKQITAVEHKPEMRADQQPAITFTEPEIVHEQSIEVATLPTVEDGELQRASFSLNLVLTVLGAGLLLGVFLLWRVHRRRQKQMEEEMALMENVVFDEEPDNSHVVTDEITEDDETEQNAIDPDIEPGDETEIDEKKKVFIA